MDQRPVQGHVAARSVRLTDAAGRKANGSIGEVQEYYMNFQDVILTLQDYWARQGCAVVQPVDLECGAGTFNPSTFLRVIGPEPWKAAYVEPSRRPTDGRYGDNPNRLQHYFQFQVIMKPAPPPRPTLSSCI